MRYKNTKTGFVFESKTQVNAEGWVLLDPPASKEKEEAKPTPKKRTTKK